MNKGLKGVAAGIALGLAITVAYEIAKNENIREEVRELIGKARDDVKKRREEAEIKKAKRTGDTELNKELTEKQWEEVLQG